MQRIFGFLCLGIGVCLCALWCSSAAPDRSPNERLVSIEKLIQAGDRRGAVHETLHAFGIAHEACREIRVESIAGKAKGVPIAARTAFDQIVRLDPEREAFRSARFLSTMLARETIFCVEYDRIYRHVVQTNPAVAPESMRYASLKELSAQSNRPESAPLVQRLMEFMSNWEPRLGDLLSMKASLEVLNRNDILSPPQDSDEKASEEFAFYFRNLMDAFMDFYKKRKLLGTGPNQICDLNQYVPDWLEAALSKTCVEAREFLKKYAQNVD